jgi:hypothetical protein
MNANQKKPIYITISFTARNHSKLEATIKAVRFVNPGCRLFVMSELNEHVMRRRRLRIRPRRNP